MLPGMKALLNFHPLFVHFPMGAGQKSCRSRR
jgi:hypothetical protein